MSSWAAVQKQPLDGTHANSWFRLQSIDPTIFIDGTVNVRSRLRQEELTEDSVAAVVSFERIVRFSHR